MFFNAPSIDQAGGGMQGLTERLLRVGANSPPNPSSVVRLSRLLSCFLILGSPLLLGQATQDRVGADGGHNETGSLTPNPTDDLKARFARPPLTTRLLKIIHGWPDNPAQQDAWHESLLEQGFGGVVCNVAFDDYLNGEAQWAAFQRAVRRAREAGMVLWLYDERGYPSATAGGQVLRDHPEWRARGLLVQDHVVAGSARAQLELPPGDLRAVNAYPVGTNRVVALDQGMDLRGAVKGRDLSWLAPTGTWRVLAVTESPLYEGTHAAMNLDAKLPYPNLLSAAPTERFVELTHEAYARRFPEPLGRWFVATFTDEPSLMSLFLRPMPYGVLPWDDGLEQEYRVAYERDLGADLPALLLDYGPAGKGARYGFWRLVSRRVADNYFGLIRTWCRQHGLLSGGHLLMEESLTAQVALYGDGFACLRRLDAPSIDCLTSLPTEVPWRIARLALSAAVLEGNSLTMCETSDHSQQYRPDGDTRPKQQVSEAQIRGTLNRLMAGGINTFTSYYTFNGLDQDALRRLNEWVGRCTLLLREGQPAADIAVVLPTETLWTRTFPSRGPVSASPDAGEIENCFGEVCEQLFASRRDFLCIDAKTLTEGEVREGALHHAAQRWPVILLPGVDTLPVAAWRRLETFVHSGGVLIALGQTPENSAEAFPSTEVAAIGQNLLGAPRVTPSLRRDASGGLSVFLQPGSEGLLVDVLDQIHKPFLQVESLRDTLRLTSRRVDGETRHFLINDSDQPWEGRVTVTGTGDWEWWDPRTGVTSTTPSDRNYALKLEPYGGVFLCSQGAPHSSTIITDDVVLPRLVLRPLPVGEPVVGRGEFVRETLKTESDSEPGEVKEWRATARLTRGQVDTFLFLMFPVGASDRDWSSARCLVLDSTVPEGQRTAAQLLVVLKEVGGAEYLASSGRSLGVAGRRRTHLFWNQFQLAGWSRDTNAHLDLDQIAEVRVGWGGYYGTEGEEVEFAVTQLALGGSTTATSIRPKSMRSFPGRGIRVDPRDPRFKVPMQ